MSLDVARGSAPLLPSLGSFSTPPGRGSCGQDALIQFGSRFGSRLEPKCKEPGARCVPAGFRIGKCQRVSSIVRTDFVSLAPAAAGVMACHCRRGVDNTGRFEDSDTGSFLDPSANCNGDNKRAANGSGWMGMDSDVRDALKSRPSNGTGDGLRSGFFHDRADIGKERGWASSKSLAKESASSSRSAANLTPSWDERNVNRSGFNPTDELLLRHKASTAGIPMSLRILKRKQGQNRALKKGQLQKGSDDECKSHSLLALAGDSTYCSFKRAFSSMVFMIRELQSLTIHQLRGSFYDDLQEVLSVTQRELHSSFIWLFQQIFACTPKLMLAVMLLVANYTVYSMGNHVALSAVSPPPLVKHVSLVGNFPIDARSDSRIVLESSVGVVSTRGHENRDSWLSTETEFSGTGGSSGTTVAVSDGPHGESGDHLSRNGVIFSSQDRNNSKAEARAQGGSDDTQVAGEEVNVFVSSESLVLNRELKKRMVAPVRIEVAPDNYSCYDRTELIYRHALCSDATNALLLANYAQFLFLVRHDHDRAEQLFCRAVQADPTDGDVITRFASFLWLSRGDRLAAEKAYRAAVDMDSSNPYLTGCLANFLWHAGEGASCNIAPQTERPKGVADIESS